MTGFRSKSARRGMRLHRTRHVALGADAPRLVARRLRDGALRLAHVALELVDALPERARDLRDPLGPEEDEDDQEDDEDLGQADVAEHGGLLEERPGNQVGEQDADEAEK